MSGKLKNFSAFVDGRGYAGATEEVTPPKLVVTEEDVRPGGYDAPIGVDVGMEKLKAGFTLIDYSPDVMKLWGVMDGSMSQLTFRGAAENEDGTISSIKIRMRGKLTEIDPGTWKAGEIAKTAFSVSLSYYEHEVNGEVLHKIDVKNAIRIVGGVDQLVEQRAALGL